MKKRKKGLFREKRLISWSKVGIVKINVRGDELNIYNSIEKSLSSNKVECGYVKYLKNQYLKYNSNFYIFNANEYSLEKLSELIKYIDIENEVSISYIAYLKNEILEQLKLDRRPYDILLWTDDEIKQYLIDGINPYKIKR